MAVTPQLRNGPEPVTCPEFRRTLLSLELDVHREVAELTDRQRAVWGRFMDVVAEYLKEEGAK